MTVLLVLLLIVLLIVVLRPVTALQWLGVAGFVLVALLLLRSAHYI